MILLDVKIFVHMPLFFCLKKIFFSGETPQNPWKIPLPNAKRIYLIYSAETFISITSY